MPRKRPNELRQVDRRRVPRENDEQRAIVNLLDAVGFCVHDLSQGRATRQTHGLGDLYAVHPVVGAFWWIEVKRQKGGRVSPAQRMFATLHTQEGANLQWFGRLRVVTGSLADVWRELEGIDLAEQRNGEWWAKPARGERWAEWHNVQAETKAESRRKRGRKALRDAQEAHR